jgi:hypothetical protein
MSSDDPWVSLGSFTFSADGDATDVATIHILPQMRAGWSTHTGSTDSARCVVMGRGKAL